MPGLEEKQQFWTKNFENVKLKMAAKEWDQQTEVYLVQNSC